MKTIIFSGIPGTGKTTVAKQLANILGAEIIDVNEVIDAKHLCEEYDKKRQCQIIDVKKLSNVLQHVVNNFRKRKKTKFLIIESHMSHFLPANLVNYCFITKCELKELSNRLKKKGYSKLKISENLEAEIFNVCYEEALQRGHNVIMVDTTAKNPRKIALHIKKIILKH